MYAGGYIELQGNLYDSTTSSWVWTSGGAQANKFCTIDSFYITTGSYSNHGSTSGTCAFPTVTLTAGHTYLFDSTLATEVGASTPSDCGCHAYSSVDVGSTSSYYATLTKETVT